MVISAVQSHLVDLGRFQRRMPSLPIVLKNVFFSFKHYFGHCRPKSAGLCPVEDLEVRRASGILPPLTKGFHAFFFGQTLQNTGLTRPLQENSRIDPPSVWEILEPYHCLVVSVTGWLLCRLHMLYFFDIAWVRIVISPLTDLRH